MLRLFVKWMLYSLVIYLFSLLGAFAELTVANVLILSAILAGVNTFVRPILVVVALPINFFIFGIASIFANLLTIVIANAIYGGLLSGFWLLLLLSIAIMAVDDAVREVRYGIKRNLVKE